MKNLRQDLQFLILSNQLAQISIALVALVGETRGWDSFKKGMDELLQNEIELKNKLEKL